MSLPNRVAVRRDLGHSAAKMGARKQLEPSFLNYVRFRLTLRVRVAVIVPTDALHISHLEYHRVRHLGRELEPWTVRSTRGALRLSRCRRACLSY